jgi:mannose-1-phosphate guanylyltransferase
VEAIVLVGGEGTRLRPLTLKTPKPALTLVDRPFIFHMIEWLAEHGVDRVVLACGFRSERLHDALDGAADVVRTAHGNVALTYVTEPDPRGTAGAIRFAADAAGDLVGDRFLALNGDVLADLDLTALIAQHEQTGARATLGLYPVEDVTGYGLVRRAEDGQITDFLEKPDPAEFDTDEINAGTYVLERDVLDLIDDEVPVSIERDVFPRLVGQGLYGRRLEGYWLDIGTPERFLRASWDILDRRVHTQVETTEPIFVGLGADLDPAADVGPHAVIGAGATVEAGACVWDSLIGEGATVAGGAVVERSIVGPGARIEPGIRLVDAVVGHDTVVATGTDVAPGARIPATDG